MTATRAVLEERKRRGLHAGMYFTYGNPARSTDPERTVPGARTLIVGARRYHRQANGEAPGQTPDSGPRGVVARYAWADEYAPLRRALARLAGYLRDRGRRAEVVADDNRLVDRAAAHRAGLGWYGKNSLLLLPDRGSWFVLGSVITDAALEPDGEPVPDGCGPCTRCLSACPTGALIEPGVLDANRCLAWLLQQKGSFPRQWRAALGGRIYGCDDCQVVCPPNRAAARREPTSPARPGDEATVDLLELLAAGDEALLARFGRWYIPGRQPRYLRRNALVALGNVGDPADTKTTRALAQALRDRDPLIRAHAVWAARRLGHRGLALSLTEHETDPDVLDELAAPDDE